MVKFTELDPRVISIDGREETLLIFLCPHCKEVWLSVKFFEPFSVHEQIILFANYLKLSGATIVDVVPCKEQMAWQMIGTNFEGISITPSLDASAAGHWHGHITNGMVQ